MQCETRVATVAILGGLEGQPEPKNLKIWTGFTILPQGGGVQPKLRSGHVAWVGYQPWGGGVLNQSSS